MLIDETTRAGLERARATCSDKLAKLNKLLSPAEAANLCLGSRIALGDAQLWWVRQSNAVHQLLNSKPVSWTHRGEEF